MQIVDEIDISKCYMDVDKKFKGQRGIILDLHQWEKFKKAIPDVDAKIERLKKTLKSKKLLFKKHG